MKKREIMWECECGTIYQKDLKECPLCNSKRRKKSKHKNFTPIKLDKKDTLKVNYTIGGY